MDFTPHETELLDRVYRRGDALRLRRRRRVVGGSLAVAIVGSVALATALATSGSPRRVDVAAAPTTSTSEVAAEECVTGAATPPASVPEDVAMWADNQPVIGQGGLWIKQRGPSTAPERWGDGWALKLSWFTKPLGLPKVEATNSNGTGTFSVELNRAYDNRGAFVVSNLLFSTPGCWQVTASYDGATLSFPYLVPEP